MDNIHKGEFGSCCKDLSDAMNGLPNSFFFTEENGVLLLAVGYAETENGPGFFDQAVIYCPFCGKQIQDKKDLALKAQENSQENS